MAREAGVAEAAIQGALHGGKGLNACVCPRRPAGSVRQCWGSRKLFGVQASACSDCHAQDILRRPKVIRCMKALENATLRGRAP